jgi:hypothetical protein
VLKVLVVQRVLNVLVPDVLTCCRCTSAQTALLHQHGSTNGTLGTS